MLFPSLLPQLSRSYILLPLLFHQMNTGSTSRVSKHQLVSQFSAGSNATLLVKGDTVSGCKLVLLDRPRNKTCCYSAPERKETMCEPGIQSGGCRSRDTVKVEEHPGYCKTTFYNINQGDSGPYLVIFPGRVNDNEQFELNVEDDSEERTMSELLPVSDISRYEEVMDFVPGTTATVSVPGNTGSGCKFLLLDQGRNLTCCFSASSRGETLCHPDTQSIACRTNERYMDSFKTPFPSLLNSLFFPGTGWMSCQMPVFLSFPTLRTQMPDPTRSSFLGGSLTTPSLM